MTPTRREFIRQLGFGAAGIGALSGFPNLAAAAEMMGDKLPRSTPEAEGVSSAAIHAFLDAVQQSAHEFHSVMVLRHGKVIAEGWWAPYGARHNHAMYSMSKSFTSTAVGFAVTEGKLKVTDLVTSFFPKELPENQSDYLKALCVRDLLTMSVGHAKDSTGFLVKEENWVKTFLALPIANQPGTKFLYNSGATYMLSAIVQQVTGQRVHEFLEPRLFGPLGIAGTSWETCPRGINTGGWGLNIPTEGLARFGQMYLQKGMWRGKRVLSADWIAEATTFKIQQPLPANPKKPNEQSDWLQGYCYQFWRCRNHAFRGDGAFGQYTIVMPEQDAVVAITGESSNMQGELDLVWEHLLPAMKEGPLPADHDSETRLRARFAGLGLPFAAGEPNSPTASRVSGKTFRVEANDLGIQSVSFEFTKEGCKFTARDEGGEHPVACGHLWIRGETDMPGTPPRLVVGNGKRPKSKVAATGAWKDPNTFAMLWRYYETPHHDSVECRFDGDQVEVSFVSSIARRSANSKDKRPVLKGKLA